MNGHRHGWGRYVNENASFYEGGWRNDQQDGAGLMRMAGKSANEIGVLFEGIWRKGRRDGPGRMFSSGHSGGRGRYFDGVWQEGFMREGIIDDKPLSEYNDNEDITEEQDDK